MKPRSYLIATSIGDGAVPSHFIALGQELQRRGNQVAVLAKAPESGGRLVDSGLRIYLWPDPRPIKLRDALFLMEVTRRHRPDCSVANFGAVNWFVLVHWLRRVPVRIAWYHTLSTQIVLDSGLPMWRQRLLGLRKSFVYSFATHVFANSQAASLDAQQTHGVPPSKCSVQTLSLLDPLKGLERGNPQPRSLKILCVGRMSPSKGQDTLVEALARLKAGLEWQAVIIGGGPNQCAVERLAADLGVANRCHFISNLSHSEVLKEMMSADVSVVPSRAEAFGYTALEAMAVGLPVVASRTGGLREVIRDQVDGFLVPPGNAGALAGRLQTLLCDPGMRKRMGESGRERFLARFEQSVVIPQQADWMERLTAAAKPARAERVSSGKTHSCSPD